MEQRKIKKRLRQYAAACKAIAPTEKEVGIQRLLQIEVHEGKERKSFWQKTDLDAVSVSCTRGTLWTFILEQIGYLGRYCLFWQAAWIFFFCYMMRGGMAQFIGAAKENEVLVAISILPPLLVLITVEEVTKIYQRSMLEIEYATKYSLRNAVMIRMSVLCVMHFLMLTICVICMHSKLESNMGKLLVYGLTPMVLVTGILLKLMQYYQGDLLRSAAVGVYLLTAALAIAGNTEYFGWYQPVYFKVWCVVCIVGIAFGVRQFMSLNKKLQNYEQIVQHE